MKTLFRTLLIAGSLAIAGVAFAAAFPGPFGGIDGLPRWMKAGAFIGASATTSADNKISNSRACSLSYDFPEVNNNPVSGGPACLESSTASCPTVKIHDTCLISSNLGEDGGAVLIREAQLSCRTVTDGVVAKLCVSFTDAGSSSKYDLGDAGFFFRTFSNQ